MFAQKLTNGNLDLNSDVFQIVKKSTDIWTTIVTKVANGEQ